LADSTPTTYGDSEERRTRTPIKFRKLEGAAGRFHPPDSSDAPTLQKFINNIASKFTNTPPNTITIDPSQTDDPNRVIRHEGVHSLLSGLDMRAINSKLPAYSKIAAQFPSGGYGDPNTEIPAYASTGELGNIYQHPIPQNWIDEYTNQLHAAFLQNNPGIAAKYNQLTQASAAQPMNPDTTLISQGDLNASNGKQ
jgi:hypothetical protein